MPVINVNELIWDKWNIDHVARHKVVPTEVEEVCHSDFILEKSYKDRLKITGKTLAGKLLIVILDEERKGVYYPITARMADKKEKKVYIQGGAKND